MPQYEILLVISKLPGILQYALIIVDDKESNPITRKIGKKTYIQSTYIFRKML